MRTPDTEQDPAAAALATEVEQKLAYQAARERRRREYRITALRTLAAMPTGQIMAIADVLRLTPSQHDRLSAVLVEGEMS